MQARNLPQYLVHKKSESNVTINVTIYFNAYC